MDAEIEEFNAYDPHSEFLLLDDCLPVAANGEKINLQETKEDASHDIGQSFVTAGTTTRLSLGATMATNLERSVNPGSAVLATQHLTCGSLDTGSLRLIDGKCDVGEGGILILPGAGRKTTDRNRRSSIFVSPTRDSVVDEQFGNHQNGSDRFAINDGNNYDDGGGEDDGGGFGFCDDDDFVDENGGKESTMVQHRHQESNTKLESSNPSDKSDLVETKINPWALLDAHSQRTSTKPKEHKFGTTCRLPLGVTELPSKNNSRTKNSHKTLSKKFIHRKVTHAQQFRAVESFRSYLFAQRRRSKILANASTTEAGFFGVDIDFPEIPMKGLVFGDEFLYIANETAKLKKARARAEKESS